MLPASVTKPTSDVIIRSNKYHRLLRGKLTPAKRRKYINRIRKSRAALVKHLEKVSSYGTNVCETSETKFGTYDFDGVKIRRLPDYVGVADNMSQFFGPEDCGQDETLVIRGRIKFCRDEDVDSVMAFSHNGTLNLAIYYYRNGSWHMDKGSPRPTKEVSAAVSSVLGKETFESIR